MENYLHPRKYGWLLKHIRNMFEADFEIRAPVVWPGSAAQSFSFPFYGKLARLSKSNILYLMLMANNYGSCYLMQKSLRLESDTTATHLNEFDLYNVCLPNLSFEELLLITERKIRELLKNAAQLFPECQQVILPEDPFARIHWDDKMLIDSYEHGTNFGKPYFIIYIPANETSWLPKNHDKKGSLLFNLMLPPVGEVFEGSERPARKEVYVQHFSQVTGLNKVMDWFIDAFVERNQCLSVLGCGVERLAMWLFGINDIGKIHYLTRKNGFSELA